MPKGVVRAAAMEATGGGGGGATSGGYEDGDGNYTKPPVGVRWIAPVDPVTGETDIRLCFLYADMWRRVMQTDAAIGLH